ncbi:MAG: peroxiredoxin family protein [Bacteroidia bacterium]|nr:peroxiredoxin family protein [Bacteroidia bacterium]MDW8347673.1 redoxin domain-containing protein [Bacteroidia bacterium]
MKRLIFALLGSAVLIRASFGQLIQGEESIFTKLAKEVEFMQIGDKAPDFVTVSQEGNSISLRNYKGKKNVLLMFYSHSIYSTPESPVRSESINRILGLVQRAWALDNKKVEVIVITPDSREQIQSMVEETGAKITFCHDRGNCIVNMYKSAYKVPKNHPEIENLKNAGIELHQNINTDHYIVPVPVVYLIGEDGRVRAVFSNSDMIRYISKMSDAERLEIYSWNYLENKMKEEYNAQ